MSVNYGPDDPDICDLGVTEVMDDVASGLRCLVYWLLPAAALGAIATVIGLAWLALRLIGD